MVEEDPPLMIETLGHKERLKFLNGSRDLKQKNCFSTCKTTFSILGRFQTELKYCFRFSVCFDIVLIGGRHIDDNRQKLFDYKRHCQAILWTS